MFELQTMSATRSSRSKRDEVTSSAIECAASTATYTANAKENESGRDECRVKDVTDHAAIRPENDDGHGEDNQQIGGGLDAAGWQSPNLCGQEARERGERGRNHGTDQDLGDLGTGPPKSSAYHPRRTQHQNRQHDELNERKDEQVVQTEFTQHLDPPEPQPRIKCARSD